MPIRSYSGGLNTILDTLFETHKLLIYFLLNTELEIILFQARDYPYKSEQET